MNFVEEYIEGLRNKWLSKPNCKHVGTCLDGASGLHCAEWEENASDRDYERTLVYGNIRGFASSLANAITEMKHSRNFPGEPGGDYDRAIDDIRAMLLPPETN